MHLIEKGTIIRPHFVLYSSNSAQGTKLYNPDFK